MNRNEKLRQQAIKNLGRFCIKGNKINRPSRGNTIIRGRSISTMFIPHRNNIIEVIIDTDDIDKVNNFTWYIDSSVSKKTGQRYYRVHTNKNGVYWKLHHYIFRRPIESMVIDHINGNALDNRKSNLREVSLQQSNMNRKTTRGVYMSKGKWIAVIGLNRKAIRLGAYFSKRAALLARKKGEEKYFGKYSPVRK